jgi:hypothetical protein
VAGACARGRPTRCQGACVGGGSCAAAGARRAPAAARTAPATVATLRAAQVPVGGRRAPARAHPATPLVPDVGQMLALMRVAWGPSRPAAPSLRTVPPPEDGAALPVRRTGYAAGACHNPRSVPPSMTPGPPEGRLVSRPGIGPISVGYPVVAAGSWASAVPNPRGPVTSRRPASIRSWSPRRLDHPPGAGPMGRTGWIQRIVAPTACWAWWTSASGRRRQRLARWHHYLASRRRASSSCANWCAISAVTC